MFESKLVDEYQKRLQNKYNNYGRAQCYLIYAQKTGTAQEIEECKRTYNMCRNAYLEYSEIGVKALHEYLAANPNILCSTFKEE